MSIPFSITADAEDYLRNRLIGIPPKVQPVLMMTTSQTDGLKPPRWFYEGESFIIGYFNPAKRPIEEYVEAELFGRHIVIESNALKQLTGRTLSLRRVNPHYGLMNVPRYVLVADAAQDVSFETNDQTKSNFSVAALTVLGGFTGMGIIWLMICLIVSLFRIPENKFLSLIYPSFVAGWIISAIISFFFFRSVYKAKGETKFVQEQKERKYVGYGGLNSQLNWWIFLGVPTPLAIALVIFLERFARTVGEKTAVVFVVIMIVFVPIMYFCDRIQRRIVNQLGLLGWALTIIGLYWYLKTYGP